MERYTPLNGSSLARMSHLDVASFRILTNG